MKYKDISTLSPAALQETITIETENLRNLRFAHAISPIQNPMRIQEAKKTIARLKTAQRAQQLPIAPNNHAQKS